jgi:predicted nucleic acid-binding protein
MGAVDGFQAVFLDSSFLIALFAKNDGLHSRAKALFEDVAASGAEPCTIWDCVSESLTILRRHHGYGPSMTLAKSLGDLTLISYDTSHRLAAVAAFGRFTRKRPLSYVDVLIAEVLRREVPGTPALSFDRDFRALGLTVIA